jgi:hypothetical protein
MAHAVGCLCAPCRDARQLVEAAAVEHRRTLDAAGEQFVAEVRRERGDGEA